MPTEPPPTELRFPDADLTDGDIVAVGGDLEPGTLLAAYRRGLFPMPAARPRRRRQIAWFSPDPRGIIPLDGLHVSRSLRRSMRRFGITRDEHFDEVIRACADPSRHGAWIDDHIVDAYVRLHRLGWAHSVEVHDDAKLVGGLYGVRIERFFAGESMFHRATDASKVALVALVDWLIADGVELLDVQWLTPHLASLGAIEITRDEYLERLAHAVAPPPPRTGGRNPPDRADRDLQNGGSGGGVGR